MSQSGYTNGQLAALGSKGLSRIGEEALSLLVNSTGLKKRQLESVQRANDSYYDYCSADAKELRKRTKARHIKVLKEIHHQLTISKA